MGIYKSGARQEHRMFFSGVKDSRRLKRILGLHTVKVKEYDGATLRPARVFIHLPRNETQKRAAIEISVPKR